MTISAHSVVFFRTAIEELNAWFSEFPSTPSTQLMLSYEVIAPPKEFRSWHSMPSSAEFDTASYAVEHLRWNDLCSLKEPERDWEGIMRILRHVRDALQTMQGYCFYARALWAERDYASASRELQCALTVDPCNAFAMQLLGETKYFQKDYYGAVDWLTNSIAANSRCGRTFMGRALAFEKIAESLGVDLRGLYYKQALRDFSSAYLLLPTKQLVIGPAISRAQLLVEEFSI